MGGVAGHMNHLYDNPNLTFGKMKDIFIKASEGKLVGTEKTDGVNLFVSYSIRDKKAKAARNKSNLEKGGLTPEELKKKFAGRDELMNVFFNGFAAFEAAVRSMPIELQLDLFGPDANIFYNAEIMDPQSPNVVNYDTQNMVIHRVGHLLLDKETGKAEPHGDNTLVSALEDALRSIQSAKAKEDYGVQVNALQNLRKFASDGPTLKLIKRLDDFMSSSGMSDNNNIGDFLVKKTGEKIEKTVPDLDSETKKMIQKRMLGQKGSNITTILKNIPEEQTNIRNFVTDMVQGNKKGLQVILFPVEDIVHDFSVEALKGLESAFILDNDKEVKRLQKDVSGAINAIKQSDNEDAMRILDKQLKKLKSSDKISTATEGFVFDYDGITYKFTGNFAPVNQLLGLFKYGRGKIPPIKIQKSDTDQNPLEEADEQFNRIVAVFPGKFKPPHAGHLGVVEEIHPGVEEMYVLVSPREDKGVTADVSKKIWEIYLRKYGLHRAQPFVSTELFPEAASPVQATYEFIESFVEPGDKVILVLGDKDIQDGRYRSAVALGQELGVEVEVVPIPPQAGGISASGDLKPAMEAGDEKSFKSFLPSKLEDEDKEEIWKLIKGEIKEISIASAVVGYSDGKEDEDKNMISRESIIYEAKLRELIRKKIKQKKTIKESVENKDPSIIYVNSRQKEVLDKYQMEYYFRKCVRNLILQEKEELPPHRSTGINVLEDLLRKTIPIIKTGYKSLTTDLGQRNSFRSHIVNAVVNSLAPIELNDEADEELKEIELDVEDEATADKFLDIGDSDFASEEEEEETFETLPGRDLTGRNVAMQSFEKIEKQIVDAYSDLDNEKDQQMFYDYFIANLKLYFDKFEDQLKDELPEPASDTYEKEKEKAAAALPESPPQADATPEVEEPLEERLMKKRGIGKQINESSITPALSYQLGYNQYYRNNADGDDKAAVRAGMVKALEDADAGPAEAMEVLDKVSAPSTASGGSKDLYNRFQSAKEEAVKQYFDAKRSLSPMGEVYSKKQRDMACARKEKEPEFAEMCTGPMKKKKKKKKSS